MANAIIGNTPIWYESGVTGSGPAIWYGNVAPNGDTAPWLGAPISSQYCYKSSTTAAIWYEKMANNGADADWVGKTQNGALIMGAGTTGTPITTATANKNFIDYKVSSSATTAGSDTRAMYLRLYLAGATTGGGDCLRVYTTLTAAVGTARGIHSTVSLATGGSASGTISGVQGTLDLKAGVATSTMAPIVSEYLLAAATSAPSTGGHSFFRAIVGGDATNKAAVKNLFSIEGCQATAASSGIADMITTGCAGNNVTATTKIRCLIDNVPYWILATAVAPAAS